MAAALRDGPVRVGGDRRDQSGILEDPHLQGRPGQSAPRPILRTLGAPSRLPTRPRKAAAEERRRRELEAYNGCKAEQRSLQSLLNRYPNKEKHDAARIAALDQVETALRLSGFASSSYRRSENACSTKPSSIPNGNLPPKLRRDLDANTAVIAAQLEAIANQKDEAAQKNKFSTMSSPS